VQQDATIQDIYIYIQAHFSLFQRFTKKHSTEFPAQQNDINVCTVCTGSTALPIPLICLEKDIGKFAFCAIVITVLDVDADRN
jgi:hypothetical protein